MTDFIFLFLAIFIDIILGDPFRFHPVIVFGFFIDKLLDFFENLGGNKRFYGYIILLVNILIVVGFSLVLRLLPPFFYNAVKLYLLYSLIAIKSMEDAVKKVIWASSLSDKRKYLSYLVSRDTHSISHRGILSSLIETISENSVDGALAPIFYAAIFAPFGLALEAIMVYKMVSTMDSMMGYKNERFIDIGRAGARADDFLNYIPARISNIFTSIASLFLDTASGLSFKESVNKIKRAFKVYSRDKYKHESPNSAHSMSFYAGLLGVQISGPTMYFGKIKPKPFIGDDIIPLTEKEVIAAISVFKYSVVAMAIIIITIFLPFI